MAQPKWITPAGNLGIIPELDYWEFPLDAYDASGGTLVYSLTSGRLPLGVQLVPSGRLQGIPVSELGGDANVEYRFTIRVRNTSTGGISDRTFQLTITNVAPPIITPKNVDLGLYLDGSIVNLQLQAIEFTPSADLTWSLSSGELPPGLELSSTGLISGYIRPIPEPGIGSVPGWDLTPWDFDSNIDDQNSVGGDPTVGLGWDFFRRAISKTFTFTVEVFDGVNYDQSTYKLKVFPRSSLTADNNTLTVDTNVIEATYDLSIDSGEKHDPIITTTQDELVPVRQASFFSFNIDAIDLDGDVLEYSVPITESGAFDEQDFTATPSLNYVPATVVGGYLTEGVYPKTSIAETLATITLFTGNIITANVGDFVTQAITGANSVVRTSVTNSREITVTITNSGFAEGKGNIAINGVELAGIYPQTVTTGEPEIIVDRSAPAFKAGDIIKTVDTNGLWRVATVTNETVIKLAGNTKVVANTGDNVTQSISSATATVNSIGDTVGTITLGGSLLVGAIQIIGDLVTANVGDFVTQPGTGANATVTSNVVNAINIPVRYTSGTFTTSGGNLRLNGSNIASYPTAVTNYAYPVAMSANIGDVITQATTGANATVLATVSSGTQLRVQYNSGNFATGSGNIAVNGSSQNLYPTNVICETDIDLTYTSLDTFYFASNVAAAYLIINGANSYSYPKSVVSVGVTAGSLATEGTIGFDEGKFDQGALALPAGLSIDQDTGWLTGQLSSQTINQIDYDFEVVVKKRDDYTYQSSKLYSLTVLGDLNNRINWITPSDLGTIQNGKVSDLFVTAQSTKGKVLIYTLKTSSSHRLPQGLILTTGGLLSGRVSFEMFSLDQGTTTIDKDGTTFDETYTFTVTASDLDRTVSADRTFTVRVIQRNIKPYENLYLKALPSRDQRDYFASIMQNYNVFPRELIYRSEDPWFGLAKDLRTLFLPGLEPSTMAEYMAAVDQNHFTKRVTFGAVKTAQALDSNFNVKYEVVYLEVFDENTNADGQGPANSINLTDTIDVPYYDSQGNAYTVAYPNAFSNMADRMATELGFANKGALPDWMTSRQADGRVLGFTRAVVLAYTVPNASKLIAYRFNQQNYQLNSIEFTVDRYLLDNNFSEHFDVTAGAFLTSTETTFDRYPALSNVFRDVTNVTYASDLAFEEINNRSITSIRALGGIDGIRNIKQGDTLVFATQEFRRGQTDIGEYNQGWSRVETLWDGEAWDNSKNTAPTADDLGWDQSTYVPGYNEHNFDPSVANQRIGVWKVNLNDQGIVTLEFIQAMTFYDKVYVRNGFTYGGTNIYYDPLIKTGNLIPNYSIIPQEIRTEYTSFDGNGTRFFDYRDTYSDPGTGDKYIKFAKTGVFN